MLFSHPAFLWGLLAVAIPVIVHLFNFRRYRKVYFSNVERLSELHTEQRRRSTLRQWLVLAMRVLAVVFLVLAFAQPVLPKAGSRVHTAGNTAVSIYVDNSFSMANASADGTLLDAARQKVREVVEAYAVSDQFHLITNDMKGSEMRWLNRDEMLDALDEIEPSPAAPLMSTLAKRQLDFMRQNTPTGAAAVRNRHAYVVSDFQRSTADLEALPADSSVLVTLVPLSAVEADNIFIDSVVLDAPAYFTGGSVTVDISLRNSGSHDVEKVPVKLTVDGQERAVTTVDIAAEGTAHTKLVFRIERSGWTDGCVTIEDYPLTFDDNYHFALHVGDRIRVLHIDGGESNESLKRLFSNDSSIDYHHDTRLQHDLTQFDFVILDEPQHLASGEVQQLTQWVLDGGSLLAVPATATDPAGLNSLLLSLQAPQLDRWVQRRVKASGIDYESALYNGVFSGRSDEMEMPTVQGHYTFGRTQSIHQSVITLGDGGDLLSVTPAGEGRLYLFTMPLTAEHTDFVNQALFVPTLYNMALYSRPLPPASHMLGSTEPIALQGTYELGGRPPELTDRNGFILLPDLRRIGGRQQLVLHGELTHDGIYTLGDEHLAFNYPRRESQMDFLERREIAKAIEGRDGFALVRNVDMPLTDELKSRDGGHQLWRLCIILALVALAAETLLLKMKK